MIFSIYGFFVPEGHMIVARRFIAGSVITPVCVPEGAVGHGLFQFS
jgi:hypothetical protein